MIETYFLAILRVEHDGVATRDELGQGLGMALDDLKVDITLTVEDGMTCNALIAECLGIDDVAVEQIEELIKARKELGNGT